MPSRAKTIWQIAPSAPADFFKAQTDVHPLLTQTLYARGCNTPDAVRAFLAPPTLHAPDTLRNISRATERIANAIQQNERIAIYGDYDCDGVTACALMMHTLRQLGAQVEVYIPDRFEEGYGLNNGALDALKMRGVSLVITVDCGARAIAEAAHAREIGLNLIVTDHHETERELPDALMVNPKQPGCNYPFKSLAGVGVAYKLAQALCTHIGAPFEAEALLDLVAIGTVADVMPLVGENRTLVRDGLRQINDAPRIGVAALIQEAGARMGHINAGAIGFTLGPRLNAAGRLESAINAYELLTSDDKLWTRELAHQLNHNNAQRQQITASTVRAVERELSDERALIFASSADYNAGIIGLAAARLSEKYTAPSVVVSLNGNEARGSCRSVSNFHITRALDECKPLLSKHGGHAAAAGFSTHASQLAALQTQLLSIAQREQPSAGWQRIIRADAEINLHKLSMESYAALQELEPYGHGNPQPLFVTRKAQVLSARRIGQATEEHAAPHLKLSLRDARNRTWDAVGWRMGDRLNEVSVGAPLDLVFHLDVNEWNGETRLQLVLHDVRASDEK